jgi:hypothetical protein
MARQRQSGAHSPVIPGRATLVCTLTTGHSRARRKAPLRGALNDSALRNALPLRQNRANGSNVARSCCLRPPYPDFGRGKPFADLVNDFRCAHAHPEMEDAMKSLAILSLILGVVVTSVPAQAQTRAGTQVQSASFNGLFFDKSATGGYEGYPPPAQRAYRKVARQRN